MAFDLIARIKLVDNLSAPMRRAMNTVKQMDQVNRQANKSFERMNKAATLTNKAIGGIGRSASGALSSITSLKSGFIGLATAIGGAYTAKKIFDSTIKQAAIQEMSQVQIKAMFMDDGRAKSYMDMVEKMAITSPLLNSQQMLGNSKSFLGMTQDSKVLGDAWKVVEKLMAWSPERDVNDAVFSMRELFASQDIVSLTDRFSLSREDLHAIKNLNFKDQIKGLDKILNKLRITDNYIKEIGSTAIAQWNQIKEKSELAFRTMGDDSLRKIKPQLERFNRWLESDSARAMQNFGSDMLSGFVSTVINGFNRVKAYIDRTMNSPAFKNLSIEGKVKFLIEDVTKLFTSWMATEGRAKLDSASKTIVDSMALSIKAGAPALAEAGMAVGGQLGASFASALVDKIMKDPVAGLIVAAIAPGGILGKMAAGGITLGWNLSSKALDIHNERMQQVDQARNVGKSAPRPASGGATPASTFKGVMGGVNTPITGNNFYIREEADVEKVARQIAKEIYR